MKSRATRHEWDNRNHRRSRLYRVYRRLGRIDPDSTWCLNTFTEIGFIHALRGSNVETGTHIGRMNQTTIHRAPSQARNHLQISPINTPHRFTNPHGLRTQSHTSIRETFRLPTSQFASFKETFRHCRSQFASFKESIRPCRSQRPNLSRLGTGRRRRRRRCWRSWRGRRPMNGVANTHVRGKSWDPNVR